MKIIVIGGGIVGLSTARAARDRGHEVVLLERQTVPHENAASWDSHRMIRHHYAGMAGYTRMVDEAFPAWDRLWADLGETHYAQTGVIAIGVTPGDYAHQTLETFRATGTPHEVIEGAELRARFPQYKLPETGGFAVWTDVGGPLFADRIVAALAAHVRAQGVTVREGEEVVGLDEAAATVRLASGETVRGDAVVVCAGAWVNRLLPDLADIPVIRQVLCYVTPPPTFADAWSKSPALVAHGPYGGYILPGVAGTDLKFGSGPHRRHALPDEQGFDTAPGEAREIIADFSDMLHDVDSYEPIRMKVGYYLMREDRRFEVKARGRAVVVTNCDGQMFKFGPLMGERIMAAIDQELSFADLFAWGRG